MIVQVVWETREPGGGILRIQSIYKLPKASAESSPELWEIDIPS